MDAPLYCLLGTGEGYSSTAQHIQDSLIFFIQLNYAHKSKHIRCCHPMLNLPATKWYLGFYPLFLNSAILHSCFLASAVYIYWYLPLILDFINYFCWIELVCIYRYALRHIVGFFFPPFLYLGDEHFSWSACFSHMVCIWHFIFYVMPRTSYGYIQCGFIPCVVWRFSNYFPAL